MIELINVNFAFGRTLLRQRSQLFQAALSFKFLQRNIYVFRQENGSGKSTLFQAIAGVQRYSGQIIADRETVILVDQFAHEHLDERLSVRENINQFIGRKDHWLRWKSSIRIEECGIEMQRINKPVAVASGGEKQFAIIMAALHLKSVSTYLLDEPFSALDNQHRNEVWRCLLDKRNSGACILLAAHSLILPHFLTNADIEILPRWEDLCIVPIYQ